MPASSPLSSYFVDSSRFNLFGYEVELSLLSASVTALAILVASRVAKFVNGLRTVNCLPGFRVPFQPLALPGAALPSTWWNPGLTFTWNLRQHVYKKYGGELISAVPFLLGTPAIYTNNLDVARQVAVGGHKSSFIKPESGSKATLLWGMNLLAADGDVWRKHRRIMGPAFNNNLYQLVWSKSLETCREMMQEEGWNLRNSVDVPVLQKLTFKFTLLIIAACGFGFPSNWNTPLAAPDGNWLMAFPVPKLKRARTGKHQLMHFMRTQVLNRKAEIQDTGTTDKNDVFSMLIKANEDESGKYKLDDQELIGNMYIMLFAGHDTTAHMLAATLGFLALYNDIQEEVLEQIVSVVGYRDPEIPDYPKLNKVLSVFYEALRLFPSGYIMIREACKDTVIQVPNPPGQNGSTPMPVLKGVQFIVDMIGVQYNPRYFDKPEIYKPSRWYDMPMDSEIFSAFSVGQRGCIGRKFATTEAVAFLSLLLRDWKVEPLLKQGETKEQWRSCVLDARIQLTLGVADVPIKFTRRTRPT